MVSMSIIASVMPAGLIDVDRHQIIAAFDLHAMAGVVDDRDLRARTAQEFADRRLLATRSRSMPSFTTKPIRAGSWRWRGVVDRVGQRRDVRVGAVADHERDAPRVIDALSWTVGNGAGIAAPAGEPAWCCRLAAVALRLSSWRGRLRPSAARGEPLRWPGWLCCRRRRPYAFEGGGVVLLRAVEVALGLIGEPRWM